MKLKRRIEEVMQNSSFEHSTNPIVIADGAIDLLVDYVAEQPIVNVLLVVDDKTFLAAWTRGWPKAS
ncbi:hypothetical protein [Alkalicoccobacillus plakortidis]|uniref:Uncharacterized protein n=1 Tax=Alkalicoccobacillus plakortidis TaxID=444060 RepID=A0ABT0XJ87_9BACI|nr:hypothetical protein [Alkalicoccobacillus plakortidis]MCM2675418.1 hypothetical protein [Alkalicoccobacillus plakortidis]